MLVHKYPWTNDEISLIADNIEHPPRIIYKKYVEKFGQIRSFNAVKLKRLKLIDELDGMDKDLKEIGPARNTEVKPNKVVSKYGMGRILKDDLTKRRRRNAQLKDFSELVTGNKYRVKLAEGHSSELELTFEYMDDCNLYFRANSGCVETFPRHRNLVVIFDKNSNMLVCKPLVFAPNDKV
jgi:hypothetical protein